MNTTQKPSRLALIGLSAALAVTFTLSAASNCLAGTASFCEGTLTGAGGTTGIPNGHFFSMGVGTVTPAGKLPKGTDTTDCEYQSGTGTEVIDGECTVNGIVEDPCVITANNVTIVALNSSCMVVGQAEGTPSQSTPGLAIVYATTGLLNGCATASEVFPFNGIASAYSVSVSTTHQVPASEVPGIGTCPVVGAGGIATCVSQTQ